MTLDALEALIPQRDKADAKVSKWSVGMQINHSLLATQGIMNSLADSEPGAEKPSFSLPRTLVLFFGRIPRGKGKAPETSLPKPSPSEEELLELVAGARKALKRAEAADPKAYWRHFKFGVLTRDTGIKFVHIHNRHHLSLIKDILAA